MRVEIDEEKERKEMAFALSISIEMIYSPRPLINHLKESEQAHPYLSYLSKSRTF